MNERTNVAPNRLLYSKNVEVFKVSRSSLLVSAALRNGEILETREVQLFTAPENKKLKDEYGFVPIRIVEKDSATRADEHGNPIVGGVNSIPEPIQIVLFASPETLAVVSARKVWEKYFVTIHPASSLLEWDGASFIPVYEFSLNAES